MEKNKTIKKTLTPEMQRCLDIIKDHGCIVRYAGGFWQKPNDELKGEFSVGMSGINPEGGKYPLNSIGTNTINALVSRELIIATDHRNSGRGEFAIKYEISWASLLKDGKIDSKNKLIIDDGK